MAPLDSGEPRGGRLWREGLKAWLHLLRDALGGGRALKHAGSGDKLRAALEGQLGSGDPAIQVKTRFLGFGA